MTKPMPTMSLPNFGRRGLLKGALAGGLAAAGAGAISSCGGGGGGGGSAARLQAPQDQQVPYANEIQNVNISNPIIRRASIRRERADSQRGRLNQWQ